MTFRIHTDATFVRDELHFRVRAVPDEDPWAPGPITDRYPLRWDALLEALEMTRRPGIVYTMSRRDCDELAHAIRDSLDVDCLAYHAGLDAATRCDRERAFLSGAVDLIVATSAFGMGIDKPDVRTVVHWTVPPSPEALYQEAGRAGRGRVGQPADAVLLFNDDDLGASYRIIRRDAPTGSEVARADQVLRELADHANTDVVTVSDDDLAQLALFRSQVQPRVVLAHLERAGLVRELDRFAGAYRCELGPCPDDATGLQRRLLELLGPPPGPVRVIIRDLVDELALDGLEVSDADVRAALGDLERRGVARRVREISVALLVEPTAARVCVQSCKQAARMLWRLLERHHEDHGPKRYLRDVAPVVGDAARVSTAMEILAAYGLVETAWADDGRSTLPGVRVARNNRPERMRRAFLAAEAVCLHLRTERTRYRVEDLAATAGVSVADLLEAVPVLHLAGAASVDLEGWSDASPVTARRLLLLDHPDRDDRLVHAEKLAIQRAREQRLRLEVLRRYATLEPDDDSTIDVHQAYLHRYLSEPGFLDVVAGDAAEDTLTVLNDAQRDVVRADTSEPLVVIAGPGTGKTRTVVHRIAFRVRSAQVLPERVLAATFSRAATEEVRVRLAQLAVRGVHVRTLHSLAVAIVRDHWAHLGFTAMPTVIVHGRERQDILRSVGSDDPRNHLAEIDLARAQLRAPSCLQVALGYDTQLRASNRFDLGQALVFAGAVLADPYRARGRLDQFDEILVDEFQDLSPAQIKLVDRLAADGLDPHLRAHLTIVGDPRQAIYEWNGANPDALIRRSKEHGSISLVENYRSDPAILDLAHQTIRQVLPDLSVVVPAPGATPTPQVSRSGHDDEPAMVSHVVAQVQQWLADGVADDEIGVLTYRGASVSQIGRAMRAARIPSHEAGLPAVSGTEIYRRLHHLVSTLDGHDGSDEELPPMDIVDRLLSDALGPDPSTDDVDDAERLRAEILDRSPQSVTDLDKVLDQVRRGDEGPRGSAGVTLTTLHRSKGLEWDAVAVTDVGAAALDGRGDQERCRLLYVGLTRARARLDVSWNGAPSRWL